MSTNNTLSNGSYSEHPYDPYYDTDYEPDYDPDDPRYTPPVDHEYTIGSVEINDEQSSDATAQEDPFSITVARKKTKKGGTKTAHKVVDGEGQQEESTGTYQGCWAIDQIIIVNTAHIPEGMQADFDPVDPSDWLEFPGAHFKVLDYI